MAETMTAAQRGRAAHGSLTDWSGWDYLPGLAFLVIGVLALMLAPLTSAVTSIYLAVMLCVAGGFALVGGLANIRSKGSWLSALLGVLSIAVGVIVLRNPFAGAVSLVWLLGAWFLIGGISEIALALTVPLGRAWLILMGVIDLALGAVALTMSPAEAILFLGYFVGISFVFSGLWSIVFTGALHRFEHRVEGVA